MSASRTKKERQAIAAQGLTPKQQRELEELNKKKRNAKIYTIVGIVAAVAIVLLLVWDSGVVQKNTTAVTIGDKSYGVVDLDYYYYSTYSTYYSYATYFGLDTSVALDQQEYYDGYTWDDMLKDSAVSTLTTISILVSEAEAAGYELSEEGQESIASAVAYIAVYAALYGVTEDYYLQASYGPYITLSDYERIITDYQLASEFAEYKEASFEVTDDEIAEYYAENSADLETIDYVCYLVTYDRTTTDDDGNSVDLDDETLEANRAEAEARAQEILDAYLAGDTDTAEELVSEYSAANYSNFSSVSYYSFGDWMMDTDNQAGSGDVIAYVNSSDVTVGYYAIYINERYLDEYCAVSARVLTISAEADDDDVYDMDACLETAEEILAAFEATDMTSDDFTTIYDDNGGSSSYEGGLIESITKGSYTDEVDEWLYASGRSQGDYQLFLDEDNNCYYLIYFEEAEDTPYWMTVAAEEIREDKYTDWVSEITENYAVTTGFAYRFVGD